MSWQPPAKPPSNSPRTYYEILQVQPEAHSTIIRYAYRYLAATYHPDNSESGDTEKFKVITEAWSVLSDAVKRQAYDAKIGLTVQLSSPTTGGSNQPKQATASLSWSEVELRLAVLQVLMEARRKRPQTGGASAKMLMDCLNCQIGDIEYVLWYLREKGYILRGDSSFMITVAGVDYLIDQLSRSEPMNSGSNRSINLPAPIF